MLQKVRRMGRSFQHCFISEAKSGMCVAKEIYHGDNVVLSEGIILTERLINSLKFLGISEIYVYENGMKQSSNFKKTASNVQKKFFDSYYATISKVKNAFENIQCFKQVSLKDMMNISQSEVLPLINSSGAIHHLQLLGEHDNYTLGHSLNVSIISGLLGKWLGYQQKELDQLVLTGLLHDIGKLSIPYDIINKKGKLTDKEMRIMRMHAENGYKILKNSNVDFSRDVLYGVLEHHERRDGSGYPYGLKGVHIHPFAKIIAVVDVYDALSSDRSYKSKIHPFAVVEILHSEMFEKLDPKVCSVFMYNVKDYFNDTVVELSDGRHAVVVRMGHFLTSRPMVRTTDGDFIDLEQTKDLHITKVIETTR